MKKSLIPLTCALCALALLISACGSESSDTGSGESAQTFSPSQGAGADDPSSSDAPTFENGVLTTPDVKVQITRYKIIKPGQKGNEYGKKPVIAFWYRATNLSGEKVDPGIAFILPFKAYQDNNPNAENELDVGSLPDDRFLDSQMEGASQVSPATAPPPAASAASGRRNGRRRNADVRAPGRRRRPRRRTSASR